jgi:hypothetical protein
MPEEQLRTETEGSPNPESPENLKSGGHRITKRGFIISEFQHLCLSNT